jgi:hypothetical protein
MGAKASGMPNIPAKYSFIRWACAQHDLPHCFLDAQEFAQVHRRILLYTASEFSPQI